MKFWEEVGLRIVNSLLGFGVSGSMSRILSVTSVDGNFVDVMLCCLLGL